MKITTLIAAAGIALTGIAPLAVAAPAEAQHVVVRERTVVRHDRPRYRHRPAVRRVCDVRWRNGHRVRVCRTVRTYR